MPKTFADLGVSADLVAVLSERGITTPFPIQSATLRDALAGRDLCGRAPTGSGKTLAFGLALASRVAKARPGRPRALVLLPTRELAEQVRGVLEPLLRARGRSVVSVYGGVGFEPQRRALRRGVDVLVACPGRLADLVGQGDVTLADVDLVVVDEADRLADMGFLPEVRRLLDRTSQRRQTLLFSATLDGDVDVLVRRYQRDPARHELESPPEDRSLVEHRFLRVSSAERVAACAGLVAELGSTVVFTRTKHGADRVARQLAKAGVESAAIHGGRSQPQRDRALRSFHERRVSALVATDVAARGIHVDNVCCVVHFDPPGDEKDYVHRSGRTGRAGAKGVVVSLVQPDQTQAARRLQTRLGLPGGDERHEPRRQPARRDERTSSAPERRAPQRRERERNTGGRTAARRGEREFAAPWHGKRRDRPDQGGGRPERGSDRHDERTPGQRTSGQRTSGQRQARPDARRDGPTGNREPAARSGGKFSWQPERGERAPERRPESGGKFSWNGGQAARPKAGKRGWRPKRAAGHAVRRAR